MTLNNLLAMTQTFKMYADVDDAGNLKLRHALPLRNTAVKIIVVYDDYDDDGDETNDWHQTSAKNSDLDFLHDDHSELPTTPQ